MPATGRSSLGLADFTGAATGFVGKCAHLTTPIHGEGSEGNLNSCLDCRRIKRKNRKRRKRKVQFFFNFFNLFNFNCFKNQEPRTKNQENYNFLKWLIGIIEGEVEFSCNKRYGVLTIDWVFGGCGKGTPRSKKIEKGNRSTKHLFSFLSFVL